MLPLVSDERDESRIAQRLAAGVFFLVSSGLLCCHSAGWSTATPCGTTQFRGESAAAAAVDNADTAAAAAAAAAVVKC